MLVVAAGASPCSVLYLRCLLSPLSPLCRHRHRHPPITMTMVMITRNDACTYETLEAARAAHILYGVIPRMEERARCEVFRDLWKKGYYMGGGSKLGGDWLVYPGECVLLPRSISLSPLSYPFHRSFSWVYTMHAPRPQAIRCVIIPTLLPLYKPPNLPRCVRWR